MKNPQATAQCQEALSQGLTDQVAECIKQLTNKEGHENLLLIVEGKDLIAREATYHCTIHVIRVPHMTT